MQAHDQSGAGGAARLREAIDRGRTGDKVDWPDPAAAPLGTDEEAAGAAPSREAAELAYAIETSRRAHPSQRHGQVGAAWFLIGTVASAGVGVVGWFVR